MRPFLICLLIACVGSCSTAGRQPAGAGSDEANRRAEVTRAMTRYNESIRSGPVDSTVAMFAEDGELLESGMAPLAGPAAIKAFLAPLADQYAVASSSMTTDTIEVFGDRAYQWGRFNQRAGPKSEPAERYQETKGRFVALWIERDGRWRLRRLLMQP